MNSAMAYPCLGVRASALRMSISRVPGNKSPERGSRIPISYLWEVYRASNRSASEIASGLFTFLAGIVTGTYSSIYIASALVLWWHKGQRPTIGAPPTQVQNATTVRA